MPPLPRIDVYGHRGQCLHILLAALSDLGAIRAKQEVIAYIQSQHLFDIRDSDMEPYPTQMEPKWHTMIAWARKDCVMREWMFNHDEMDHWEITRRGLEVFQRITRKYQCGELDIRRCFLWSATFKKRMCPTYEPSPLDSIRPEDIDYSNLV